MTFKFSTPNEYAFDDTPKAFKRLMQRKSDMAEIGKKSKNENEQFNPEQRASTLKRENFNDLKSMNKSSNNSSSSNFNYSFDSSSSGFKTIRAKRKAHLQARDLKKKLKRIDSELENSNFSSRKNVRDVVQEPPKLKSVKKSFKKVIDDSVQLKSWSESDDYENYNNLEE